MTQTIIIEFDPKDASPLEVINTLEKQMQTNLQEGKIEDYSISLPVGEYDLDIVVLVGQMPKEENPNANKPTS